MKNNYHCFVTIICKNVEGEEREILYELFDADIGINGVNGHHIVENYKYKGLFPWKHRNQAFFISELRFVF